MIGEKTLIITIGAAGIFFGLKVANVKPTKASMDAMDILKLTGGICGGVLVKDHAVYKKWIKELIQQQKFYSPIKGNKINTTRFMSFHNHPGFPLQWLKYRWVR